MRVLQTILAVLVLAAAARADTVTTYRQVQWDGRRWVEAARWQVVTPTPPVIPAAAPPAYPVAPVYYHPQAQPMPAGPPVYYQADPSCQTGA